MNTFRHSGLILSLALMFSLPIQAAAADAPAAAEAPAPQSMHDLMRGMRGDQEPSKCKTMKGMPAEEGATSPMAGMGMGMGGMQGKNCKTQNASPCQDKPCMQGGHKNCKMRGGDDDARMDALEKRMDMMQMMMEMMMRSGGRN